MVFQYIMSLGRGEEACSLLEIFSPLGSWFNESEDAVLLRLCSARDYQLPHLAVLGAPRATPHATQGTV